MAAHRYVFIGTGLLFTWIAGLDVFERGIAYQISRESKNVDRSWILLVFIYHLLVFSAIAGFTAAWVCNKFQLKP